MFLDKADVDDYTEIVTSHDVEQEKFSTDDEDKAKYTPLKKTPESIQATFKLKQSLSPIHKPLKDISSGMIEVSKSQSIYLKSCFNNKPQQNQLTKNTTSLFKVSVK